MSNHAPLKTPLNAWHRAHNGNMVDFSGWEMPLHYEPGILREHLATRKFGGLFDVSHMGRFRIGGTDRIRFLQHVLSNNAEALDPWRAQYTLIPNENGGVIDDAYLYRFGAGDFLLVVNAGNRDKDWTHLQNEARNFKDLSLEDHTERLAMFAFQGPRSVQTLAGLIEGGALPEPFRNMLSKAVLCDAQILVARTGYTGEPVGLELFVPREIAESAWSKIQTRGEEKGILPAGLGARDTLRLEAGLPLYGHEFGQDPDGNEIPAYAFPLTSVAVSFSPRKGDFIGRSRLAQQFEQVQKLRAGNDERSEILPRRIKSLALLDKGVMRAGHEIFLGDNRVGVVTSGTAVPRWIFEGDGAGTSISGERASRSIGLALLEASLQPDQRVEVEVRGRRLKAQIVKWHGRSEAPPYFRPIPVGWEKPGLKPAIGKGIKRAEELLGKSLQNHEWRRNRCINLIPSEMTPSSLVRLLQVSDPVGRYAEHRELPAYFQQEVFYYQGTELIAWAEERLAAEMADFLGCSLVEIRPISGQMSNMTVFSGFVDYKNRLDRRREPRRIRLAINNHLAKGGHLSSQPMGALRDYLSKDPITERFAVIPFPVCGENPYRIDVVETAKLLESCAPEILIFGKSMVLHPEPIAAIRKVIEKMKTPPLLMYDMAHVLGLIGPHFQQPFQEGAQIVTGSTHKTFFGTQRGVIGADFDPSSPEFELWQAIGRRSFPGMVSNHHLGTLLGLLLAAIEMNSFKEQYQPQVLSNAKAFARALHDQGLSVEGDPGVDFTETHQVILNVGYAKGYEAAQTLEKNNIIVNYQAIPGDESFTASSGLRLGVSEMTRFGMKEADFREFAELFSDAVKGRDSAGEEVAAFRERFQSLHFCFDDESLAPFKKKLLSTF